MPDYSDDDPIFVRVEGYRVILQDLEAIRQILENMEEAVQVMHKLDDIKEQSIDTFMENLDRLYDKLQSVDAEMPEVKDGQQGRNVRIEQSNVNEETVIDDSIKDLHSELEGLKDELDKIG